MLANEGKVSWSGRDALTLLIPQLKLEEKAMSAVIPSALQ